MNLLSHLLLSRGIDPSSLEKEERCRICRKYGPQLDDQYECSEQVCYELWGDLSMLHWEKESDEEKKDIRDVFRGATETLLDTFLGRRKP